MQKEKGERNFNTTLFAATSGSNSLTLDDNFNTTLFATTSTTLFATTSGSNSLTLDENEIYLDNKIYYVL